MLMRRAGSRYTARRRTCWAPLLGTCSTPVRGGWLVVRARSCDAFWPAPPSADAGADRICLEIRFSCIGLISGTDACPGGALRRTGPVLLLCSGIAVDEPARKADTAKAANVVFCFMRTDRFC